jgi:hypothetical protein
MPDARVTPLRRGRGPSGYSDTAALNDIHALLTTIEPGESPVADIAIILGRTGRPMVRVRDIEATTTETTLGWPAARVDAGDTKVCVRQDPGSTGLLIEICTESSAERAALTVTLDGESLQHPGQPGSGPA